MQVFNQLLLILHLIEPLGFDLHKKSIKRSNTNHLEFVDYDV